MSAQASQTPKSQKGRAEEKLRAFHEEDAIGKAYDLRLMRQLWPFVKPHARFMVLSMLSLVLLSAINLVRPLVMGDVVRQAAAKQPDLLFRDGLALTVLVIAMQLVSFAQVYAMQLAGARAMADLRSHIFLFMQRLSLRYFDRTPIGRLVTRATNDVDALGELFASGVFNAVGDLLALFGIVIVMLALDWRLSLIAFGSLPIVGLVVNAMRRRSRQAYRDIRGKTARLNAFLNEQVTGISVVQAYAREKAMTAEFGDINEAYRDANKRAIFYEAVLDAAIEMVATVCIASILFWISVRRGHAGAESFAMVVTFTGYIRQFFEPISMLSQRYTLLQSAMAGAERIFQLLEVKEIEVDEPQASASSAQSDECLALDDVTFSYKAGQPVLHDVTLVAKKGEKIALVGATGSGKTTIAALVLRLYDVEKGSVRVLGKDVRAFGRHDLREHFAVVPQDVYLFAGTLLSNIAMSDPEPKAERALEALRRIGALELFQKRGGGGPDFLEARVDDRGQNFSAGERQLIAFARAVYKDAPILILDEATASVDSDTESRLQTALSAVLEGRTSIVIAHRLSTIKAVDRIIVMHKGRIVESGTHEELLAKNGVYARLYRLQFDGRAAA